MTLKDVISTVIKNSYGFCLSSIGDVREIIKTCAKGNKTIAYSDFNDCLSVFIFDGDIGPLEVALGQKRIYKSEATIYDVLDALRVGGVITSDQMSDLFAYIDQLGKRDCIYFEVSLTKDAGFVLSDIAVESPMSESMAEVITDCISYGAIGMPDSSTIMKYAKSGSNSFKA